MTYDQNDGFAPLRGGTVPRGLTDTEAASYRSIVDSCPVGWLTRAEEPALIAYIKLQTRIERLQLEIEALDSEVADTSHGPAAHAKVMQHDRLLRRASQYRTELRLNPSARMKAVPRTKLGTARELQEQGAAAQAEGSDAAIAAARARSQLLFGGERAAAALHVDADD